MRDETRLSTTADAEASGLTRRGFLHVAGGVGALTCGLALTACAKGTSSTQAAGSAAAGSATSAATAAPAGSAAAGSASAATPETTPAEASGSAEAAATEGDPYAGTAQDPNATCITAVAPDDAYGTGKHHATIVVKNYGTIELTLDADVAPISTSNFCRLANMGFYNGLTFFRIINGFMIQGGDPYGNGTGGAAWTIKGEFQANGVPNKLFHTRGAISMARAEDNDSASSQFFIMQAANHQLDGNYAAFGHVTSGMEVVDAICDKVPVTDDNGSVASSNQPVITSITIND